MHWSIDGQWQGVQGMMQAIAKMSKGNTNAGNKLQVNSNSNSHLQGNQGVQAKGLGWLSNFAGPTTKGMK